MTPHYPFGVAQGGHAGLDRQLKVFINFLWVFVGVLGGNIIRAMPVDFGGVAPEQLKVVVNAEFIVEEVDDDVDEVEDGPAALAEAGVVEDLGILLSAEVFHLAGDGAYLLVGSAGGDDEMMGDGAEVC